MPSPDRFNSFSSIAPVVVQSVEIRMPSDRSTTASPSIANEDLFSRRAASVIRE
jgi:hypothetical protein